MTNEEAISSIAGTAYTIFYRGKSIDGSSQEAFRIAIDAMKKQTQMAPVRIDNGRLFDAGWLYRCPVCGQAVGKNITAKDITEYDNFCANCGQLLNWTATALDNLCADCGITP